MKATIAKAETFSNRGGYAKERQQWSLNHALEVFHEAEEYDEVYDCVMVTLAKKNEDLICNPIYKFCEGDIWRYIRENNIDVNPLYAMGYKRVGCILCPLGGKTSMVKEAADFPKYKSNYIKAFDRMLKARIESGKDDKTGKEGFHFWETGEDVYNWWIQSGKSEVFGQLSIDDLVTNTESYKERGFENGN